MLIYYVDSVAIAQRLRGHVDRQYNYHTYGKMDYCEQDFQPKNLTEPLKSHIINQNDALEQFIDVIEHLNSVIALALVGGSGVGKTLTCNILESNFQWPSNVFYYVWSGIHSPASQYYKILNSVKLFSSNCGAYLVIVDNIGVKYDRTIEELNTEIQNEFAMGRHVILIVYVFNLATYLDEDLITFDERRSKLQNLSGITTVNYRSFNRNDVKRCIDLESHKLNVTLRKEQIEDLLEYIDWSRSGCKLIHSKIVTYT